MSSNLENLVAVGSLKREPPAQAELDGLVESAVAQLRDAEKETLSLQSRFKLAYNAAHALSLAALRFHGYRPKQRATGCVEATVLTLGLASAEMRVLSDAHASGTTAPTKESST